MNWPAVSAIAELIAAVAILVTLVYLAFQIRQAREQITLAGQRHRADAARDLIAIPYRLPAPVGAGFRIKNRGATGATVRAVNL